MGDTVNAQPGYCLHPKPLLASKTKIWCKECGLPLASAPPGPYRHWPLRRWWWRLVSSRDAVVGTVCGLSFAALMAAALVTYYYLNR